MDLPSQAQNARKRSAGSLPSPRPASGSPNRGETKASYGLLDVIELENTGQVAIYRRCLTHDV